MATIEILNWDDYQSRRDVKASSWYRKEHRIHFDPDWSHFTATDLHVWDYLLALASMKNKGVFHYTPDVLCRGARVPANAFKSAVEKLEQMQCVHVDVTGTLRERDADVVLQTDRQTDRGVRTCPLLEIWNANRGPLPEAKGCSGKRKSAAIARWEEKPDAEYWTVVIKRIAASSFCCGTNDRSWKASFDFLIRPDTQHKVLEGKYDNRGGSPNAPKPLKTFTEGGEVVDVPTP